MTTVKFTNVMDASDCYSKYRDWLNLNCGEEELNWRVARWRFDLTYGIDIDDPEVMTLFKLTFGL